MPIFQAYSLVNFNYELFDGKGLNKTDDIKRLWKVMKSFYFHFLEVELAQSKDVRFNVRVVIPPPWCRVWINMSKVFLFSCTVRFTREPVCVSSWFSADPNKFSLMKQICQANLEQARATRISRVLEHLNGSLVVFIDDHCQASVEVLAILEN